MKQTNVIWLFYFFIFFIFIEIDKCIMTYVLIKAISNFKLVWSYFILTHYVKILKIIHV